LAAAAYHVPGHGYSRIADTLVLSVIFAWIALRHGFGAVIVLHCIFDTLMVLSLGKFKNIPKGEVQWLANHFGALKFDVHARSPGHAVCDAHRRGAPSVGGGHSFVDGVSPICAELRGTNGLH
jgi:hypothetical protein